MIKKFVEGTTFENFSTNEMLHSACVRHLAIIGEAATNLTSDLRAKHPEVTWSQIIGMRNILVHRYFGTSEKVLWLTIEQDLPIFEKQVKAILQELK